MEISSTGSMGYFLGFFLGALGWFLGGLGFAALFIEPISQSIIQPYVQQYMDKTRPWMEPVESYWKVQSIELVGGILLLMGLLIGIIGLYLIHKSKRQRS